ncbi:tryptophan-rich sensory protein [Rhizobiaceae bacterium n13]|uniref:Tryptophan-rich sensory protein n=1 Tax=Ferirhizobium litorale TaxID=2927786 RepID=A0AAE3U4H6_9HYPH|nr:TspO/MBR family protein [Fererhizobium litorale]MDI7864562.1 tryptophan-rich sensory protein [Fererhizobium litorale]MDI7924897.1 tryptophan-rich sensory protein [Fererhizobium litorale]
MRVLIHIVFVAICLGGGVLLGVANMPGQWYQSLEKPFFNPPEWVFAPVWSVLYVLIGIAGARTFITARSSRAMNAWLTQLVLNFLWSPLFFGLEMPVLALMVIVALLAAIVVFIAARWDKDRFAALLFVPYGAWVAFATLLNASIAYLN